MYHGDLRSIPGMMEMTDLSASLTSLDKVKQVPVYFSQDLFGGHVPILDRRAIINARTSQVVGFSSKNWQPVSHGAAFAEVIKSTYSSVGGDFFGRIINDKTGNFSVLELYFESDSTDKIWAGIRCRNRYAVGSSFQISSCFIKKACTNGMIWPQEMESLSLNHTNRSCEWSARIADAFYRVLKGLNYSQIEMTGFMQQASSAMIDVASSMDELNEIGQHYLSRRGWEKVQGFAEYNRMDEEFISRMDIVDMFTAYATHIQESPIRYEEIQRGAAEVLKTPWSELLSMSHLRTGNLIVAAALS